LKVAWRRLWKLGAAKGISVDAKENKFLYLALLAGTRALAFLVICNFLHLSTQVFACRFVFNSLCKSNQSLGRKGC
jgi:hypothetical protein